MSVVECCLNPAEPVVKRWLQDADDSGRATFAEMEAPREI